jgi:MoxR-like ATPase
LDRFSCTLHLGYPDRAAERLILTGAAGSGRLDTLQPVLDLEGWRQARAAVQGVQVAEAVLDYVERMVGRIRDEGGFCSTRAAKHWLALAQAEAWLEGRDFITPDDLQRTLTDTMAHRGSLDDRRLNRGERREHLARLLKVVSVGWNG